MTSLWIKICGLTTQEAVDAAVNAGADALGFVFAASKRQIEPQHAATLAAAIPKSILRVAVMHHPEQRLVDDVWEQFRPDVLQTDIEDLATLKIPTGLAVLPVLRSPAVLSSPLPVRALFEGAVSGSGEVADWSRAAELAKHQQLILAGGLNAANVSHAISRVRPYGVDVSSGVERAPGIKDPRRIYEFITVARAAATAASAVESAL